MAKDEGQEKEKSYSWPHYREGDNAKRVLSKEDLKATLEKEEGNYLIQPFNAFFFFPMALNHG